MKKITNSLRSTPDIGGFTLIELLVVIAIIAILASIAIPAITGGLAKSQISRAASNYRELQLLTQNASLDSQSASGPGAFPGDLSNSLTAWSNALVPTYCSATTFQNLGTVKDQLTNTLVYYVKTSDDPTTIFLCTAGFSGTTTNVTLGTNGPFGAVGGAFVTVGGSAFTIIGVDSPSLTNGAALISTNSSAPF